MNIRNSRKIYEQWINSGFADKETLDELEKLRDNEEEIEERFYKELEFGTGGLRGIIGAGTNRMNRYMIRKVTYGLATHVSNNVENGKNKGVVIAYDSRYKSDEFALEAALTLAASNVRAILFDGLRPTPELSFAVRYFGAAAGIVVTASHNPREYNGYKVYGEDGGQLPPEASDAMLDIINGLADVGSIPFMEKEEAVNKGLLVKTGKEVDDAYNDYLKTLSVMPGIAKKAGNLKIVFTPLHGTGNIPVRRILSECGFEKVLTVKEQELPDPDFSTVKSPNPEDKSALSLAINLAVENNAGLVIATDPDSDRLGIAFCKKDGSYMLPSGNQIGMLLMNYILSQLAENGKLPSNSFVITTIVSTKMAFAVAKHYNTEIFEVLTGFKFIGEQIKIHDEQGGMKFLFGFEESFGYLAGTKVRDKDGVVASLLISEAAAWYASRGMTMEDGLNELFEKYGYFREGIKTFTLQGKAGLQKINSAMEQLREEGREAFAALCPLAIRDYKNSIRYIYKSCGQNKFDTEKIMLPVSDVLYYELPDQTWFCARPSGTEPKLKVYCGVRGADEKDSASKLEAVQAAIIPKIDSLLVRT